MVEVCYKGNDVAIIKKINEKLLILLYKSSELLNGYMDCYPTSKNVFTSRNDAVASQFYRGPDGALEWKDEGSSYTNPVYDTRRLLNGLSKDGVNVARFYYDAFGRRIMATEGMTTTITLNSGNDVVYELKTPNSRITTKTRYLPVNDRYLAKVTKRQQQQRGQIRAVAEGGNLLTIKKYSDIEKARKETILPEPFLIELKIYFTGLAELFTGEAHAWKTYNLTMDGPMLVLQPRIDDPSDLDVYGMIKERGHP